MKKTITLITILLLIITSIGAEENNFNIGGSVEAGYIASNSSLHNPVYVTMDVRITFFKVLQIGKSLYSLSPNPNNLFNNTIMKNSTYAACLVGPVELKIDYTTVDSEKTVTVAAKLSFDL